ncbi:MFS transporter [Methanobrevibacter sp. OttesenSCG-928-I08]|nr:MFS transporter [Methanobrevibacter sp. OttesenSCG-928-I08]
MNENKNKSWFPLIIIACASFVIALDSTFMNVAISSLVVDLNTEIGTIQTIITFYTLITASLMLVGAKLQDIIGQKKVFLIGAAIYGVGTLTAALSPNAPALFIGWSLLEGIGGALMTPATLSIVSRTYSGRDRTVGLAIVSAMAGIAAAIGPLFGGVVTTFLSWRFGFAVELLVIIFIFIFANKIKESKPISAKNTFDKLGAVLSVVGLIILVTGILALKSEYIAYSPIIIVLAIIILAVFYIYETKRKSKGNEPLLDVSIMKDRNLTVGSIIRLLASLALAGALFAVSVFLQTVLKTDAMITGLTLVPLTLGLLAFSIISPRLTKYTSHKKIIGTGFILSIIGMLLLRFQFTLDTELLTLLPGMFIFGAGLGLVIALGIDMALINIKKENQAEASGFVSTSSNLGISMGTAIIGTILIVGAFGGLHNAIDQYYPDMISDEDFRNNAGEYLNKVGNVNESVKNNPNAENIVNIVVFDAMKLVMNVIMLIMIIGLGLTFTLREKHT